MPKKLKVLISAYACSPRRGSEPGLAWGFVRGISLFHEVHVISERLKQQEEIEEELRVNPELNKNLRFYFIKKERCLKLRILWIFSYFWTYRKWQKKAYRKAIELDKSENFDVIHQLGMTGFREPGYLWKIDKPFVWGPIGGMDIIPWRLLSALGFYSMLCFAIKNIANLLQLSLMRRPRKASHRDNNRLIAISEKNRTKIRKYFGADSIVIPEVGKFDLAHSADKNFRISGTPLKIVNIWNTA